MTPEDTPDVSTTTTTTTPPTGKPASSTSPTNSSKTSSGNKTNTPAGHTLRRVRTSLDGLRSPTSAAFQPPSTPHSDSESGGPSRLARRNSSISDYGFNEARSLLNPQGHQENEAVRGETAASLAGLSLAFALLPAVAGVFIQDGSAFVTDVMLLGLAGIFLHWSVTQPWVWYHSAQEVRIENEALEETVFEEESEDEDEPAHYTSKSLDNVPEEEEEEEPEQREREAGHHDQSLHPPDAPTRSAYQQSALQELYLHETLALFACFISPLIGAYLLHAIRSQLSRPSEGLVSNYNLTIFSLVSEMRVASHLLKLLKSRTLHLQRVVRGQPASSGGSNSSTRMSKVLERLEKLETASSEGQSTSQEAVQDRPDRQRQEAHIARDVRNTIQPELDALNRAVRRYEKKATLLQIQIESRFSSTDARMDDVIALAAAAAKNQANNKGLIVWTAESLMALFLLPFNAIVQVFLLPLRTAIGLTKKKRAHPQTSGKSRSSRSGSGQGQGKWSGDRVPSRVGKR